MSAWWHRVRCVAGIVGGSGVLTAYTVRGLEVPTVAVVGLFGAFLAVIAVLIWFAQGALE